MLAQDFFVQLLAPGGGAATVIGIYREEVTQTVLQTLIDRIAEIVLFALASNQRTIRLIALALVAVIGAWLLR